MPDKKKAAKAAKNEDPRAKGRRVDDDDDEPPKGGKKGKKDQKKDKKKSNKLDQGKDYIAAGDKKDKKERKRHPALKAFFLTTWFWLFAMAVFSGLVYMNMFTLKEIVLQLLNPDEDFEVMFESDIEYLAEREAEIDERELELDDYEAELDERSSALDDREFELDDLEFLLQEMYPGVTIEDGEIITQEASENPDIYNVIRTVNGMDESAAAEMLVAMLDEDQALATDIMKALNPGKRSALLDEMQSSAAAIFIAELGTGLTVE